MFKIYTRAIILNKNNEVLLLKKNNKQKIGAWKWMPPWWTVEYGEEPEMTLFREIKEELDLDVIECSLCDTRTMLINDIHWLGLYYLVKVKNEKYTNMEPDKHESIIRASQEQLPKMLHEDLIKQVMFSANSRKNIWV